MTMNTMELDGYTAVIQYNPETDEFRGEVQGINGGADFFTAKRLTSFTVSSALRWRSFWKPAPSTVLSPGNTPAISSWFA